MEVQFWGKVFESDCLPTIFDNFAVFDENGNLLNAENPNSIYSTENGLIFIVARSIDNHDYSTVPLVLKIFAECLKKNAGKESFQKITENAYHIVSEKIRKSSKMQNYGASVTSVYIKRNKAIISQIGDNRCFLFRNSITGQITIDHTLGFELLKNGFSAQDTSISLACINSISAINKQTIDFTELELNKKDRIVLITRQMWLINCEHFSWQELGKLFSDLFDDVEFINNQKEQIIKEFIGEKHFYDSPILIFQVN